MCDPPASTSSSERAKGWFYWMAISRFCDELPCIHTKFPCIRTKFPVSNQVTMHQTKFPCIHTKFPCFQTKLSLLRGNALCLCWQTHKITHSQTITTASDRDLHYLEAYKAQTTPPILCDTVSFTLVKHQTRNSLLEVWKINNKSIPSGGMRGSSCVAVIVPSVI